MRREGRTAREQQSHLPGGEQTGPRHGRVGCGRSNSPWCSEKSRKVDRARLHLPCTGHLRGSARAQLEECPKILTAIPAVGTVGNS